MLSFIDMRHLFALTMYKVLRSCREGEIDLN